MAQKATADESKRSTPTRRETRSSSKWSQMIMGGSGGKGIKESSVKSMFLMFFGSCFCFVLFYRITTKIIIGTYERHDEN
jgi:hypothetical protein